MATFTYIAKNFDGEEIRGTFDAPTVEVLKTMLESKGYFLVDSKKKSEDITLGLFEHVSTKDLAIFSRQFYVILNSGISIVEAIAILMEQAEKQKLKNALTDMYEELQKGVILSETMNLHSSIFPEFMRSMIKVAEVSGNLDNILLRLADYYDRESQIRKKIRTAMMYPIILGVLTVGVVILLMTYVLPMFSGVLSGMGGELPLITTILISISDFIVGNVIFILILLGGAVFGFNIYRKSETGRMMIDSLKLSLPVFSVTNKKILTSRFSRSMSILLRSGIPIIDAVELMQDLIGNHVVENKFIACREQIQQGRGITKPLVDMDIFPPLMTHMVAVGEKTGELDEMMERTSKFFDDEVEEAIDKMTAMIEPIMIVILAAVVGTIILSVMLPMVSIMNSIG